MNNTDKRWETYTEFLEAMGLELEEGFSAKHVELADNDREGPRAASREDLSSFCSVGAVRSILMGCIDLFGFGTMASIFRAAGAEYSRLRAKQLLDEETIKPGDIEGFLEWVAYDFENWGYGELRILKMTPEKILVRVEETMSASGMQAIDKPVCYYEGGRITGGLSVVAGKDLEFHEVKCWGLGDDHCLFEIRPSSPGETIY